MDRPILFSGPMVKAILDGRKTMTRRVVNLSEGDMMVGAPKQFNCYDWYDEHDNKHYGFESEDHGYKCPHGKPGDRLWVRETWSAQSIWDEFKPSQISDASGTDEIFYHASPERRIPCPVGKKRPSIFMCRWMSRINLELTDVRVERLQEISGEDVLREGFRMNSTAIFKIGYRGAFEALWDSINGKTHPWNSNPWVWVEEFKRIQEAP